MAKRKSPATRRGPAVRTAQHRILEQVNQGHGTRASLYKEIESALGSRCRLVCFFTSFLYPVAIIDSDADMMEDVLRSTLTDSDELVVLLNSPGGDPLAAERIVNICRSHSAAGQYTVIVPKMAKSAATMISLGADRIMMSKTSELGPIDPQIPVMLEGEKDYQFVAAHEIVKSYDDLMRKANRTKGQMAPYLQQLQRYDARAVQRIKSAQQLSDSIAVRTLRSGVMRNLSEAKIRAKIVPLLDPRYTKAHGRPISPEVAKQCGLNVELQDLRSPLWTNVWELYSRLNWVVSSTSCKVVESGDDSYAVPAPPLPRANL